MRIRISSRRSRKNAIHVGTAYAEQTGEKLADRDTSEWWVEEEDAVAWLKYLTPASAGLSIRTGQLGGEWIDTFGGVICVIDPTPEMVRIVEGAQPEYVIVSRHPAAVAFIHEEMPEAASAPVMESVSADDVRGKIVIGNVPLSLAAVAEKVIAVEFDGVPPRGAEYGVEEMRAAGARLTAYRVAMVVA